MTMPRKGDFITASGGPVEDPRRARIFKGKFLTSDATGHPVKFNKAIDPYSAEQVAAGTDEIVRRLNFVKQQLNAYRARQK
jgi:hypothetical protein